MHTRRRFLTQAAAIGAAPLILPTARLFGQNAPSRTIQIGHIGTGGQGTSLLQNFLSVPGAKSVAIADPFRQRREAAAQRVKASQGHDPKLHNDFRELLADKSIDAVVIATPDHWHVPIGIAALRAGKDVYIEKPLGHTLMQNKALLDACSNGGRIFQYGTQQRSQEILKRGIELVLNGYIGAIQRIEVWAPAGSGGGSLDEIPVPDGLDYELYIGPAPMKPCSKDRITSNGSYFCADYSIGFIAGWGAHPLDIAIWGLDYDQKGPFKLRGTGEFPTPDALFNTCATWDVNIEFAQGIKMRFMSDNHAKPIIEKYRKNWTGDGTTFFGEKGWISLSRGGVAASNPEWFKLRQCEGDKRVLYKNSYYRAFVESVRDRSPSVAPIRDAVRSDALSHLSLLAIKSGGEVVWDPQAYRIVSPESLKSGMDHPVRGGWMDG
ncbi:MAG: Gfo/Idh/MocA family oxidoreductase [Verrucomicrobia bacterium]|nr:Gfo/Idh/MocA family oxidoreductase [Verrucomicrobiota bacterium]